MKLLKQVVSRPIVLLIAGIIAAGLLVFRDYGLTWDEPLFYKYADALGYAYTPANWLSGKFDVSQSYGPSGEDHKTRGPGYLLVAREVVEFIREFNVDEYPAWHLVNFATFVVGVYFVYRLCLMLASKWAAAAAAAFFALQPLLWGHAFINPKDMPFLVFLTGAVWLGFRMVDGWALDSALGRAVDAARILLPGLLLGLASSNRVLGPMAGLLVFAYGATRKLRGRALVWLVLYAVVALIVMIATWPYLWESPLRFAGVFRLMSDNPTTLAVLFADNVYHANALPRRYLPFFLVTTMTEAVWPLFVGGLAVAGYRFRKAIPALLTAAVLLAWFLIPVLYAVWRQPPMYDGMRHFLFVLPPIFVFAAISFDFIFAGLRPRWVNELLVAALLAPGFFGIVTLHPYEYTYYNALVDGTGGAYRHYETDYWLTCYKEAVQRFDEMHTEPVRIFVHREPDVATPYAAANVLVLDERGSASEIRPGDFVLVNTRSNEDLQTYRDAPVVVTVQRAGAEFCLIKSIR